MSTFSPSDAALEGFSVIRAQWRVIAGWSLFNLIAVIMGCVVMVVLLIGILPFVGSREAADAAGRQIGLLVLGLGGLAIQVVISVGLFRLMLRPQEPGFLHLRFGKDELRVLGLVLLIILAALLVTAPFVIAIAAFPAFAPLLIVGLLSTLVLLGLRIGPAAVATFAEGGLRLRAAWRLTKGKMARLIGMAALLICLIALIEIVGWVVLTLALGAVGGFQDLWLTGPESFALHPGRYILGIALQLMAAPFLLVISQAPWVAVYRALKD